MPDDTNTRPRLLLLDGHSLAYRAFYALPVENFATADGESTNAVFGFTSMLVNVLRDEAPTHIAVAFDESRQTFRLDQYPEYKAGRAKTPPEFHPQIAVIKQLLDTLSIPHLAQAGFEADDIIATLTTQGLAAGYEVLILTGDRDALQLVTEHSTVLYPMQGVSKLARLTPTAVEERYGVAPHRYAEMAALVGEDSDNLPGVPGVGPKTAAKWLAAYDGLSNLIARADEVKGKAGESFRQHLDAVIRNRELNALVRDLDLGLEPAELQREPWDRQAAMALLDDLEIRGELRQRITEVIAGEERPPAPSWDIEHGRVLATAQVAAFMDQLGSQSVALAWVGQWQAGSGRLDGVAIASEDELVYVDIGTLDAAAEAAFAAWLANPDCGKVTHDAHGPLLAVAAHGWELAGLSGDTAIMAYLLEPDQRSYDLADLSVRHLGQELPQDEGDASQGVLFATQDSAAASAMIAAVATQRLSAVLREKLAPFDGAKLMASLELPLLPILVEMERIGIAVDHDFLEQLDAEFAAAAAEAAAQAYQLVGREINLASPKQLQTVLFDQFGMPKTKKTKTGHTTDAEALHWLYEQTEHPFLQHLLRHRDVTKLRQTVEGLRKAVAADGRIHTTFNQTIAATGRLSSAEPNLQNIPVRTDAGRRIREVFVPGAGYEALMTADYSQIEMRIMAHLSADESLIEAFNSGHDFHRATAATVFQVDPESVDEELRARIKAMNYGLAYGLSVYGLSQQLGIPTGEAQTLMDEYKETFGGVQAYLDEVVAQARKAGYTETMMGRRRYLPGLNSSNRRQRQMAERMALNAPIQGTAADIIKKAMITTRAQIAQQGLQSRLLLQVHDELVFEIAPGEQDALEQLVRTQMGQAAELRVPLEVSVGVGSNWRTAAH